ncbi:unnamed protein product [Mesocestoides corti]|uniref:Ketoreductase domain-containing protein n=1 Tax=Mesocestoides corti TaxID=53468 RepID=A0A0R3UCM5_MESCO|nr:unnamed protein product [Mesocestoides corti]
MVGFVVALIILTVSVLAVLKCWCRKPADLSDEIILITGASRGIGRLLTLSLSKYCRSIIVVDVDAKGLEETLNAITAIWRTVVLRNDNFCRNLDEIKKFAKDVRRNYGRVTMLINNAGIVNGNFIIDIQNSSVERLIRVNLLAPLYLVKEFLPGMLGNGHFVFLSSVASQSVVASLADYCASKAGLSAVADTLRVELDIMGALKYISVTDIRPFVINTGLFEGFKCRLSWLFPILRPEDTVQRIVEAIRHREGVVYIPWWMWFIPLIHR